ncbi:Putative tagatose-6-phosphate ketose/aldose isomerase [Acinetobacter baumannii]|nr:Putative tagatose-6-phosphate ketose/aldose isomerase [Acinetobacter baumannii]
MQLVGLTGERQPLSDALLNLHNAADDIWLLFPYLLFTQMLAFESSLALGLTPDNPCPTGEVNRVVKGVTIYRFPSPEL